MFSRHNILNGYFVLSLATDPKTIHDEEEMETHELVGG